MGGGITDGTKKPCPSGSLSLTDARLRALIRLQQSVQLTQTGAAMITNEVFSCFVFYAVLLVIKMYVIAIITGQVRLRKKVSDFELGESGSGEISFGNLICFTDVELLFFLFFFLLPKKGFRQPRGRAETWRLAVPQRGPVRGEMPEVMRAMLQSEKYSYLFAFLGGVRKRKKKITYEWSITEASNGE